MVPPACQVVYDDGEVGWLWMGVERVRLLITAGEELAPPDAATLQQLARRWAAARVGGAGATCTPAATLSGQLTLRQAPWAVLSSAVAQILQADVGSVL